MTAYEYDGLGRRRKEALLGSTTTWFRWLGMEESGEYVGTVGSWTIGAMQTGYVPGMAAFAGANPTTAEWRYELTDHLGSVRHLTGQNKAALARYDYAPYGELMRNAGLPLTVGYTGHRWDAAIGQYFAPFRYYNPQTARWNVRDPLGMIDGPNVYAYVAGNPVGYCDLYGNSIMVDGFNYLADIGECLSGQGIPNGLSLPWWHIPKLPRVFWKYKFLKPYTKRLYLQTDLTTPISIIRNGLRNTRVFRYVKGPMRFLSKISTPIVIIDGAIAWARIVKCGMTI